MFASFVSIVRRTFAGAYARIWGVFASALLLVAVLFGGTAAAATAAVVVAFAAAGWRVYRYDSSVEHGRAVRLGTKTAASLFLGGLPVWASHGFRELVSAITVSAFGDAVWRIPTRLTAIMLDATEDMYVERDLVAA